MQCNCVKFEFDFIKLEKTTFCAHRFFHFFTTSDASGGATVGHVVSPSSIMVLRGFRSKEAMHARKQRY